MGNICDLKNASLVIILDNGEVITYQNLNEGHIKVEESAYYPNYLTLRFGGLVDKENISHDVGDIKTIEKIIEGYNQKVEELKRPFKVGNIITGKPDSKKRYGYTTDDAVMRVDEVLKDGYIEVTVLEHINPDREDSVNRDYRVEEKWFRRVI